MATIVHCDNNNHSFVDFYSFAAHRGKSLIVFKVCEICGGAEVIEMPRGRGRRRVIVKLKLPELYKQLKEKKEETKKLVKN